MQENDIHPARKTQPGDGELMYVKCAFCGAWMDVKPGHLHNISHSLCDECFRREMQKIPAHDSESKKQP